MGIPGLGHLSYVQMGRETDYGTPAAATRQFAIVNENVDFVPGFARSASLNNQRSRRGVYPAGQFWRGTMKVELDYEGFLMLLDAVFGTDTFGVKGFATGGGGPPYSHTFTELAYLNSFTLEIIQGDMPVGTCLQVAGAKFRSVTFSVAAVQGEGAILTAEFEVIARAVTPSSVPTTLSNMPADNKILFHHATVIDDGVATSGLIVKSAEFKMTQPTTEAERLGLGSVLIGEPLPNDFMTVSAKFGEEFDSIAQMTAVVAGTPGSPELTFTDVVNSYTFSLRIIEATAVGYSAPITGYGIIESTLSWEGYRSPTNADDSALFVTVVNGEADEV